MPRKLVSIAGILLLAGIAPAVAQDATPEDLQAVQPIMPDQPAPDADTGGPSHRLTGPAIVFNLIDRDRDGSLDMSEATILFETIFITVDRNDDGKLSKAEINAALQRLHGDSGPRNRRGQRGPHGRPGEHGDRDDD